MPQSFDRIILHTTFSTKYRIPYIDIEIESQLYAIIASEMQKHSCIVRQINGTPDHVHIIHSLPRTKSIAEVIRTVKAVSSGWIKSKGPKYEWFEWQDGYAVFSADYRNLAGLERYVRKQKEHHRMSDKGLSFQEEFTRLLHAYGFQDINEAYVFPEVPAPEGRLL